MPTIGICKPIVDKILPHSWWNLRASYDRIGKNVEVTHMTLGERIAQKRKEMGLSQEQLGAELGVSRQAIYKWESDLALPEIEKLVILAERFHVSVGWLLCVEDISQEENGELTAAQLNMVEEIARRYRPQISKCRRWGILGLSGAVLVVLIVIFSSLFVRLNALKKDNSSLRQNIAEVQDGINSVQNSVQFQINEITNEVKTALEQQTMLISSFDCEIIGHDAANKTVTFRVSAVPKTYTEGMRAVFSVISDGETITETTDPDEGQQYKADITCPLTDAIQVSVTFVNGETRETQLLEQYVNLYSDTLPLCYPCGGFGGGIGNDVMYVGVSFIDREPNYGVLEQAAVTSLRVGLFQDKKLIKWLKPYHQLTDEQQQEIREQYPVDERDWEYAFVLQEKVPLDEHSTYCIASVVQDEYGRTMVYEGDRFRKSEGMWGAVIENPPPSSDVSQWSF